MGFTPIILIHVIAATGALVTGGISLKLKKGTLTHRLFGRIWVGLMLVAALVSFGIRTSGHFSWIHLLSAWIVLIIGMAVHAAVKGNIRAHKRRMTGAYIGLVIAGAFTFLPSRLLGQLAWQVTGLM